VCDPDGERCCCLGEVLLEPHLAFEVRVEALDHRPRRGKRAFAVEVGGGAGLLGGEQGGAVGGESLTATAAREGFVGDHGLGRGGGQEVAERLDLVLVGRHERVAERQPAGVGEKA
jgi:hypothetical protein